MKFFASTAVLLLTISMASTEINCPLEQPDDSIVVQFPSPTNCSEFYKCDRGVPFVQSCPAGLHYNPKLQVCDYVAAAGCVLNV